MKLSGKELLSSRTLSCGLAIRFLLADDHGVLYMLVLDVDTKSPTPCVKDLKVCSIFVLFFLTLTQPLLSGRQYVSHCHFFVLSSHCVTY